MERNINPNYFISSQKIISKSSKFGMKEFVINKFLKLRLEEGKTIIYVNNERFNQCKYLLLDIPIEEVTSLEDIESIDDLALRLDRSLEHGNKSRSQFSIPPEVEFWGHCSNLQVWYENNYNTKLIHSNLAFPLLKKLMEAGDRLAEKVFKEEIAIRFKEGNDTVRTFLSMQKYLDCLDHEEFCSLFYGMSFDSFNDLLQNLNRFSIVDKMTLSEFFEFIESLDEISLNRNVRLSMKSKQLNFLQTIIENYKNIYSNEGIIKKIFKKLGTIYFDYLLKNLIKTNNYINLPIFEALVEIDPINIKEILITKTHKFEYGFKYDSLSDFQHILNLLLNCFNPEELINYLDRYHRNSFFKMVLPKMRGFRTLNMATKIELEMKHYITAFLIEIEGGGHHYKNLKKLGVFLSDILLSEIVNINGEVDRNIEDILRRIGEAEYILKDKLYNFSKEDLDYMEEDIPYHEYLKRLGALNFIDNEMFCDVFRGIRFESFKELLEMINFYSIIDIMTASEFLDFIDSLNSDDLKNIVIDHKKSNRLNFLQAIFEYLNNHDIRRLAKDLIDKILTKIGVEYFNYLMDIIVDSDGYINLPVFEVLVQIHPEKIKSFLETTKRRFRLGDDNYILLNFHRILNSLLACYNPEELMNFLESSLKNDFIDIILPKLKNFKSLYMSEDLELDMNHYITAFLLEEVSSDIYFENLKKMGSFLEDIILSELFEKNGNIRENIKEVLYYVGEMKPKLSTRPSRLFDKEGDNKRSRRHSFY